MLCLGEQGSSGTDSHVIAVQTQARLAVLNKTAACIRGWLMGTPWLVASADLPSSPGQGNQPDHVTSVRLSNAFSVHSGVKKVKNIHFDLH